MTTAAATDDDRRRMGKQMMCEGCGLKHSSFGLPKEVKPEQDVRRRPQFGCFYQTFTGNKPALVPSSCKASQADRTTTSFRLASAGFAQTTECPLSDSPKSSGEGHVFKAQRCRPALHGLQNAASVHSAPTSRWRPDTISAPIFLYASRTCGQVSARTARPLG